MFWLDGADTNRSQYGKTHWIYRERNNSHVTMHFKVISYGTTPVQCPSWAILSLDHMGRVKQPCCIGSADSNSLKPICEQCGLSCYSVLVAHGIRGEIDEIPVYPINKQKPSHRCSNNTK